MIIFSLLFTVWSITNIIVHSTILKGLRKWLHFNIPFLGSLFSCVMCMSVWVGLFLSYYITDRFGGMIINDIPVDIIFLTFISSGFSYIMDLIVWKFFIQD